MTKLVSTLLCSFTLLLLFGEGRGADTSEASPANQPALSLTSAPLAAFQQPDDPFDSHHEKMIEETSSESEENQKDSQGCLLGSGFASTQALHQNRWLISSYQISSGVLSPDQSSRLRC